MLFVSVFKLLFNVIKNQFTDSNIVYSFFFPQVKFLKSISTTCIPNFPDKNLPTIFVYFEGDMRRQFIGAAEFGNDRLKCDGKFNYIYFPIHKLNKDLLSKISASQIMYAY